MKTFISKNTIRILLTILYYVFSVSGVRSATAPNAYVSAVWCHDKEVTDSLRLDHRSNNLRFYFHNREGVGLDSIYYQVKLEGVDVTWHSPGEPGWTWYPELAPGNYDFRVRCRFKDQLEWGPASTYRFSIETPWWGTGWAIAGYIVLAIALVISMCYLIWERIKSHNALVVERENSRYRNNFVVQAASRFRTPLSVMRSTIEKFSTSNPQISATDVRLLRDSLNQLMLGIESLSCFEENADDEVASDAVVQELYKESENYMINPGISIMVAEPDMNLSSLVKSELQPLFNVIVASDEDLYGQIQKAHPNVLVIDTGLHGIDAFRIVKKLRSDSELAETIVIMTSDLNSSKSLLRLVRSDADDFLNKPYDSKVLIALVFKHLRKLHVTHEPQLTNMSGTVVSDQTDSILIENLDKTIDERMDDSNFGVSEMQQALSISRVKLYERIRTIMRMTPLEYLRYARLKRASQLLLNSEMSVKEIRVAVGMPDATAFHRHFRDRFGMTPKEYRKQNSGSKE